MKKCGEFMKKKVALLGGSFDPIHTDHLNIAKVCYEQLNFDEVWFIPAYLNPFKTKQHSLASDRLAMLKIIADKYSWIRINEYEIKSQKPIHTYTTLSYLKNKYVDDEFCFIMGSDQLDNFEKWNNFSKLINLLPFKVFLRETEDKNHPIIQKYHLEYFTFNNLFLSSTKIRKLENLNLQIPEVNDYINNHLLYLEERLRPFMDKERYIHSINTGKMAEELALKWNVDHQKAKIAGTLHDIAKCWPLEKSKEYIKKYAKSLLQEPVPVWHSFVGSFNLEKDWLIKDKAILQAVFNHTTGSVNMNTLDIVVFCADKISLERSYPHVEEFRQLCFEDLIKGFKAILKNQYNLVIKKNNSQNIGLMLQDAYTFFVKQDNKPCC